MYTLFKIILKNNDITKKKIILTSTSQRNLIIAFAIILLIDT